MSQSIPEIEDLRAMLEKLGNDYASYYPPMRPEIIDKAMAEIAHLIAKREAEAEHKGAINALTQLKVDRIAHTLSTDSREWTREIDFIEEHIKQYQQRLKG